MIFNWISRCWGGMGISTQFEKARINCTIADWTVPYQDDILILITSFQDKNPEIPAKAALNTFLSHLQTDDQKSHPAFLLKHLYILDHCVQEMTALDIIGYYYNSNLTVMMMGGNNGQGGEGVGVESKAPLRVLVNSYYAYLIAKARTFGNYEKSYFSKEFKPVEMDAPSVQGGVKHTKTRDEKEISFESGFHSDYMCGSRSKKRPKACTPQQRSILSLFEKQASYNSVFDVIEKCQQLQRQIMEMSRGYQAGNRKVELIKYVFIMCLWTFIRCYVIVSVGVKYLFKQFLSMSLKELERFIKMFSHFNGEYTADFIRFVETNKNEIEIFREINYNELTYVNKDSMRVLLDYKEELKAKQGINTRATGALDSTKKPPDFSSPVNFFAQTTTPDPIYPTIFDELQSQRVIDLPLQVHTRIKQNMKIFYKPRKNMNFCLRESNVGKRVSEPYVYEDGFEECRLESAFFGHQNLYHEAFMVDVSQDDEGGMGKSNHANSKQITQCVGKRSAIKADSDKSSLSPIRKLSIDKDIDSIIEDKPEQCVEETNIKLTKSQLINSSSQKRSTEPIKQSQMSEIKEMFQQRSKEPRRYVAWEMWENEYGVDGDVIGMRN